MIVFTICSRSMVALALGLHQALMHHQSDWRFCVVISDGVVDSDIALLPFDVVGSSASGLPDFEGMSASYDDVEFRASLKPFGLPASVRSLPRAGLSLHPRSGHDGAEPLRWS